MANCPVVIANANGEEDLAEKLAQPLREIGYTVAHQGTVLVGESVVEEVSKILSQGGPVVLCGTVRAMGTKWARRVVSAARRHDGVRVFVVQMDEEADVESFSFDEVIARYWQDPAKAVADLQAALRRYYPPDEAGEHVQIASAAEQRYRELLLKACDLIDLANLPEQDRHIAHRQLELRRLYVPLRVWVQAEVGEESDEARWEVLEKRRLARMRGRPEEEARAEERLPRDAPRREPQRASIGERLSLARRLVVLGDPGAGKTTLTRWIATAFLLRLRGDPDWSELPDVKTLPKEDWLPILVRCRDMDDRCLSGSLDDILHQILHKLELAEPETDTMHHVLQDRLASGTALLLVDGLDEIADPAARARFCQQLQQIHRAYPQASIITTSRVVGYREMGVQLGREFEHVTLADLEREEKDDFAHRWCMLTERPERRTIAQEELIHDIHSSDRIERLTGNPMLLTTMALVKRKVGILPRRRADLYWEAVQVLLNWRSEVDEPIDPHEAVPQLAYLAYAMCDQGVQQLRRDQAIDLLAQMRQEYPNLYLVRRQSPQDFMRQVQARTGILLEAGHATYLGMSMPVYEFRHLTFQEYLAARALVDGYFPGRNAQRELAENVAPLAGRTAEAVFTGRGEKEIAVVESWREPLRLVMGICHNDDVDSVLRAILTPLDGEPETAARARAIMAMLCLADEPNASDSVVQQILQAFAHQVKEVDGTGRTDRTSADVAAMEVARVRWADELRTDLLEEFYRWNAASRIGVGGLCARVSAARVPAGQDEATQWVNQRIDQLCESTERHAVEIALTISYLAYEEKMAPVPGLADILLDRLAGSAPLAMACAIALEWLNGGWRGRYGNILWSPTSDQINKILAFISNPKTGSEAVHSLICILAGEHVVCAVDPLVACLDHGEATVRSASARALGEIKSEIAVESLIARLGDADASVRSASAKALGEIKSELAVESLIARLGDADASVRHAAIEALGNIGSERAIEPLVACLDHGEATVQNTAARALGKIGDNQAVEPLVARLDDTNMYMRSTAAGALGNIGSERAVKSLVARLRDSEASVRSAAAEALGNIGSERAIEPLVATLADTEDFVRGAGIEALGNIGSGQAVESLVARLQDTEASVRHAAIEALGSIGNEQAVEPLVARLDDTEASVRIAAAEALGNIGSERTVESLVACLQDIEASVRSAAAEALGNIRSEQAVGSLVARLQDSEAPMRSAAAEALGNIGSEQAVESLVARLQDTEASVRCTVAEALGNIGNERAVKPLVELLEDADINVQSTAAMALGNLCSTLNRYADAVTAYKHASGLNESLLAPHHSLGALYQVQGKLDNAVIECQTSVRLDPRRGIHRVSLASVLRKLGREAEAAEQIRIARRWIAYEGEYNRACFESVSGNVQAALTLLEAVLKQESEWKLRDWARRDPNFDWIRDDPQFQTLVEQPATKQATERSAI